MASHDYDISPQTTIKHWALVKRVSRTTLPEVGHKSPKAVLMWLSIDETQAEDFERRIIKEGIAELSLHTRQYFWW